jgi:hypothetical protein
LITADSQDVGANFLVNGGGAQKTISPRKAPEGTYTFRSDAGTFTFTNIETLDDTSTEVSDHVPVVVPKLIVSDGYVTGFDWKWMWRVNGVWTAMTADEVKSVAIPNSFWDNKYFVGGGGVGSFCYSGNTGEASGSATFATPFLLSESLFFQTKYTDIQGYTRTTTWLDF